MMICTDAEATINAYDTGEEYDEHTIYFVYELDNPNEWTIEKCGTSRTLNWVAPRELKPCEIRSRWRRKIQSLSTTYLLRISTYHEIALKRGSLCSDCIYF